MNIEIRNEQNLFEINEDITEVVEKAVKTSLEYMGFEYDAEISVMFVDNSKIHELNKIHRGIDRATDVLSFPMFEYDEDGNIIEEFADFSDNDELVLGDIVISLERAKEQSEEYGHSLEREVGFLTVHSMLHLLGYDHLTSEEEAEMFGYQTDILNEMGLKR